ncbi:MAG: hypothetical protein Q4D71_12840, partial [Oscillospiraceae bacterium]|nr:hypothetical protein [Oscillospiraceae bacterium]
EVTAPDGYEVAEDVKFTVKETGEIQKVAMVDAPKGSKTTTPGGGGGSSTPKSGTSTTQRRYSPVNTGDTTDIVVWIVLLILGGIMVGAVWIAKNNIAKDTDSSDHK